MKIVFRTVKSRRNVERGDVRQNDIRQKQSDITIRLELSMMFHFDFRSVVE